jgi:hypothetical protein
MRTYDDSFSGQKIYPGKVRFLSPRRFVEELCATEERPGFNIGLWIFDIAVALRWVESPHTFFPPGCCSSEANIRCVLG